MIIFISLIGTSGSVFNLFKIGFIIKIRAVILCMASEAYLPPDIGKRHGEILRMFRMQPVTGFALNICKSGCGLDGMDPPLF
jgi:hypothetical protein